MIFCRFQYRDSMCQSHDSTVWKNSLFDLVAVKPTEFLISLFGKNKNSQSNILEPKSTCVTWMSKNFDGENLFVYYQPNHVFQL